MPKHIIISRTDNMGDVILTLPMAAMIKQQWSDCKVSFLARNYVKDVVERCMDVDQFISYDTLCALPKKEAVSQLAAYQADVIIHAFPNRLLATLARAAKIPMRIGTSHRWYHWFTCNQRVNFTRKNSTLHEAQLNLQLFAPLGLPIIAERDVLRQSIHLRKQDTVPGKIEKLLDPKRFNLIVHALTNGNTKEWPIENFIVLIKLLPSEKYHIILTGTEKERARLQPIVMQCPQITNAIAQFSLTEFTDLVSHVDGLLANSTGPLHLAAAFGIHALGLFPADKGKDPSRWEPLGARAQYLVAERCVACTQATHEVCICMQTITVAQVAVIIQQWDKTS